VNLPLQLHISPLNQKVGKG